MYSGYLCVGVHVDACELCVSLHVCTRLCMCVCLRGVCVWVVCCIYVHVCMSCMYHVCVSAHMCMYELCACVPVYEVVCLSVCMCVSCVCLWVVRVCVCVCVCELLKLRPSDFRDLGNGEETEWDPCLSLDSGLPVLVGWMAGWPSGRASSPALGGAPSVQWANPPVPPHGAWVCSAVWAPLVEHVLPDGPGAMFTVPAVPFWIRWASREWRSHCSIPFFSGCLGVDTSEWFQLFVAGSLILWVLFIF